MSADNGIYILKTKDQYRVAHLQAIDNVYYSYIEKGLSKKLVPTRVVEMWGKCKFTRDAAKAMEIANNRDKQLQCEYGINVITYNKTWKHILEDAQEYAKQEIEIAKEQRCNDYHIQQLQDIADGKYLSEWLNRNKRNQGASL